MGGSGRLYHYVGPDAIRDRARHAPPGTVVVSAADLLGWLAATGQRPGDDGVVRVTFVVDPSGDLRVADRHSEHVACAAGGPVLSAGEAVGRDAVEVVEASNQSTGFCPEPESWPAVAATLDRTGLPHPGRFTTAVVFRRCPACGQRNIVKDGWSCCAVCDADLPADWNFG